MNEIKNEDDIIQLIKADQWMMNVLQATKKLQLPDWWICAGFIRAKVWDVLHSFEGRTKLPDIDVIYFDRTEQSEKIEKTYEQQLRHMMANIPWSVKNEARMHVQHQIAPYESCADAIAKFPETATAIGVRLNENNQLTLLTPHGIEDLLSCTITPTPFFKHNQTRIDMYEHRINSKKWHERWDKITYV